jgi:hypothetical protein
MRLTSQPSSNFQDRTAWTPAQNAAHGVIASLNPVQAARNVHKALIHRGVLDLPKPSFRLGFPRVK